MGTRKVTVGEAQTARFAIVDLFGEQVACPTSALNGLHAAFLTRFEEPLYLSPVYPGALHVYVTGDNDGDRIVAMRGFVEGYCAGATEAH